MNREVCVLLGVLAGLAADVQAQSRPASASELEAIRDVFELDEIPEWKHYSVLDVQGTYSARSDTSEAYLTAEVYLKPYEVQFDLCVMEAWLRTGMQRNGTFEWSAQRNAYWNWLRNEGRGCEISDRTQVPEDAVTTNEPIPSASLSYVLKNASELLALYYDRVASEPELAETERERLMSYRNDSSFMLSRLEITAESVLEIGFAYSATYRSHNLPEGPAVSFSITESGFIVHSVGLWIA